MPNLYKSNAHGDHVIIMSNLIKHLELLGLGDSYYSIWTLQLSRRRRREEEHEEEHGPH
jgi:hypothetical protein